MMAASAAPRREEMETTREEILASRRRRARQIEDILEDAQRRLRDHDAGTRLLAAGERADLEKKITIYQRKLDTMRGDLDEKEVQRILQREKLRDERLKQRRAQRSEL